MAASPGYTAKHLLVLEGLEAVRKRPGMYIGSTDSRGLHALPLGDRRQRGRRGPGRFLRPHRGRSCTRTARSRSATTAAASRWTSSPRPACPASRSSMTKLHAGREVRRRLLRRLRRPARRRRLRGQRAVRAARRRGRPGRASPRDQLPPRRARRLRRRRARRPSFAKKSGLREGGKLAEERSPAPGSASGRTTRSSCPTPRSPSTRSTCAPGRPRSWCPGLTLVVRDSRRRGGRRARSSTSTAASREFSEFLARDEPVCDVLRLHGRRPLPETVPVLDDHGHMTSTEVAARARRGRRAALGQRATTRPSGPSST